MLGISRWGSDNLFKSMNVARLDCPNLHQKFYLQKVESRLKRRLVLLKPILNIPLSLDGLLGIMLITILPIRDLPIDNDDEVH